MSAKLYPFIDIAVHERVRAHFARGDAAVLFSLDMAQVFWSNGQGAALFGFPAIYDFIDTGANRSDPAYRQLEAAARQLTASGDIKPFLMRVASGFQRVSVNAQVEMITVRPGETGILFTAPRVGRTLSDRDRAAQMISGFDDPDTHMAVLDGDGAIVASSSGFEALGLTPQTCRLLVEAVGRDSDWLLKRPIPTGKGRLPAAIGKLSDDPALHLLFAVETILGHLDAETDFLATEEAKPSLPEQHRLTAAPGMPDDVIEDIGQIEDIAPEDDRYEAPVEDDVTDKDDAAGDPTFEPPTTEPSGATDAATAAFAMSGEAFDPPADTIAGDDEPEADASRTIFDPTDPEQLDVDAAETLAEDAVSETAVTVSDPVSAADTPDDADVAAAYPPAPAGDAVEEAHDDGRPDMPALEFDALSDEGDLPVSDPEHQDDGVSDTGLDDIAADPVEATTLEPSVDVADEPLAEAGDVADTVDETAVADAPSPGADPATVIDNAIDQAAAVEDADAVLPDANADGVSGETLETAAEGLAEEDAPDSGEPETSFSGEPVEPSEDADASHQVAAADALTDIEEGSAPETAAEPETTATANALEADQDLDRMEASLTADAPAPTATVLDEIEAVGTAPSTDEVDEIGEAAPVDRPAPKLDAAAPQESEPAAVPAEVAQAGVALETEVKADPNGFSFDANGRAVRFVWKIDADGRFSEVSKEFAAAVGPRSADVVGQSFAALAARYGLDPDDVIGELLRRRDTWSGKTVFWPVEGTRLHVPVDLAALPTYSRTREFDGFRGFGIVRIADAVEDEHAMGLDFADPVASDEDAAAPSPEVAASSTDAPPLDSSDAPVVSMDVASSEEADVLETVVAEPMLDLGGEKQDTGEDHSDPASIPDEQDHMDPTGSAGADFGDDAVSAHDGDQDDLFGKNEEPVSLGEAANAGSEPGDPFLGERPALKLIERQDAVGSEKVVQLDHHRPAGGETLSRSEQAAFREIARQLGETFGKRPNEALTTAAPQPVANAPDAGGDLRSDKTSSDESEDSESTGAQTLSAQIDRPVVPPAPVLPSRNGNSSLTPEMLDNLPLALLVHGGDVLFHANSDFLALTGYADLDALRMEGGIDALFTEDEEALANLPDGSMMVIRSDGRLVPVSARLQSIRWEDKNALMMALSAVETHGPLDVIVHPSAEADADDDEPVSAIETLQRETEELRSILETATDGVVVVGAEGDIRSINRSASALFNYDEAEVRGKPFAILFAHESQKAVLDYLSGLAGHGVASVLNDGREVIGREASGGFIPLFMTMGRLSSSNGFCAVIRDITQWKRTEEELRTAKRAAETANAHKTDFLARVSHEIRTPLNAIIGFSDMMASEHFGPIGNPRYVEYAGDIGRSGRHVLDIVNDLLDISKIEAGEMDLEFTAVEINEAISEAVSLVQPQANSQRVIIRTSLSGAVPSVVADNRSIKQMALNILSNAIRFTPSGGQIVVSTAYEANGSVILRIRDTGVGMTRTELEQAMKPFRQVITGARKRGDGTGLGLPLTKAMAEANRAQFSIHSAPNEGTLVEITFPSQRVLAG